MFLKSELLGGRVFPKIRVRGDEGGKRPRSWDSDMTAGVQNKQGMFSIFR